MLRYTIGQPTVTKRTRPTLAAIARDRRRIQTPRAAPRLTNAAPWTRTVTVARAATCSKAPRVWVGGAGPASAISASVAVRCVVRPDASVVVT